MVDQSVIAKDAIVRLLNTLMKEQLTTDLSEAVKNVVGMVKVQGSPGRGSDGAIYYNLRGFPTKIGLVDGLPANTNGEIDPADVERIEVIKGPSGTLYGGAATSFGGLVNLVTKKPKDYYGGQVSYLFGSYNLNRLTVDVFGPITSNRKTLFRLNTAYQYQNGFRDSEFRKSFFAAPTFSYEANDRLTTILSLRLDHYNSRGQLNLNTNIREANFKQTALSPKFGVVYQVLKDKLSAYGNYMNSFSYVPPADNSTTGKFVFPAYTLLNASISLERDFYRFGVKMNNISNAHYFSGQGVVVAQMSRNFAAELSLKF